MRQRYFELAFGIIGSYSYGTQIFFVFPHVMYLVICIPNCGNFLAVIGFVSIAEHQLHVDQRSIFRTYQTDYVQWGLGRIWDSHMNRIVTFKREAQV